MIQIISEVLTCQCFAEAVHVHCNITKSCLFKYTENFTTKNEDFQIINSDIFHISAQNIHVDCGYSLELPQQGGF